MSVRFEDDFLVAGTGRDRVTPNFTLGEYQAPDGSVRMHREILAAVQMLRDALDRPVSIASVRAADGLGSGKRGQFVWIESGEPTEVVAAARALLKDGTLARVEVRGARVYLEMPDPAALPALIPANALERAIQVTAAFETSGNPYHQVTGNFDGAGLSFGPIQVNFGTGTLPVLFKRFEMRSPTGLKRAFGPLWDEWQTVMKQSRTRQIAWADALSRGRGKADFDPAWKAALQAIGDTPAFREEMLAYAYDVYGRKLIAALAWLHGACPIDIGNFRCLAALYDLCVQQGSLVKAYDAIRARIASEHPQDEFALTRIAVEERGKTAGTRWRADCISRRLCILEREPVRVDEAGQRATRTNPRLYLLRNAPVKDMAKYLL
ncbi:hypothetical protein [Nitrogeniibacter mangrovi]|nr:hypothetical protein [Nitrogeniibacter mangrovi]